MSKRFNELSSNRDANALKQLLNEANNNADNFFRLGDKAGNDGNDSLAQSMYDASSAYSILSEGISHSITSIENGDMLDSELVEITGQTAAAKISEAVNAFTALSIPPSSKICHKFYLTPPKMGNRRQDSGRFYLPPV